MNFFRSVKNAASRLFSLVTASFDVAKTTKDNVRHWAEADYRSADADADHGNRSTMRIRSRYEVQNNSYAKGLVQMLANDTIGTGPRLQMLTSDEEFNNRVERSFARWAEAVKLPQKLRTMRMARCQDGEAFAVIIDNPRVSASEKVDISVIESDRITDDIISFHDPENYVDGIQYDEWGNPVSYRMLKHHPGGEFSCSSDAITVPARYMIHTFRQDRPEQHRGVPELSAALPLFAQLRRFTLATLSSAEAAADFAAILYTDSPPDGETESVAPMDSIPLERNMMMTVPAGWKMGQLESKHPTSNHSEFVKILLSEIARSVCATYGSVSGDFSKFNYASGRLDNQVYHKSILVDRSLWESDVLNKIFHEWYREFLLSSCDAHADEYDTHPRHTWFWDGFPHVDPTKEANAQAIRLKNMTTTLAEECARDGKDYMSVLLQRKKEISVMNELGIYNLSDGEDLNGEDDET